MKFARQYFLIGNRTGSLRDKSLKDLSVCYFAHVLAVPEKMVVEYWVEDGEYSPVFEGVGREVM